MPALGVTLNSRTHGYWCPKLKGVKVQVTREEGSLPAALSWALSDRAASGQIILEAQPLSLRPHFPELQCSQRYSQGVQNLGGSTGKIFWSLSVSPLLSCSTGASAQGCTVSCILTLPTWYFELGFL